MNSFSFVIATSFVPLAALFIFAVGKMSQSYDRLHSKKAERFDAPLATNEFILPVPPRVCQVG